MLLAQGSVKKAFKTARVCLIRHAPLKAFLYSPCIQKHYAKSGSFGFFNELRKRVRTFHGRYVFYWGIEEGIEVLAKPIFVRGVAPSMASTPRAWPACLMPVLRHGIMSGKIKTRPVGRVLLWGKTDCLTLVLRKV